MILNNQGEVSSNGNLMVSGQRTHNYFYNRQQYHQLIQHQQEQNTIEMGLKRQYNNHSAMDFKMSATQSNNESFLNYYPQQ